MPKSSAKKKTPPPSKTRRRNWRPLIVLLAILGLFSSVACAIWLDWWSTTETTQALRFVGRQSCAQCHPKQAEAFAGSHHDLAMDVASKTTVLGDFSGVNFSHHGIESRLYRDGERFMIHTEGPQGAMQDFEVKYVFGVTPLQQYMVEFDRHPDAKPDEIGRLQVLRICWDTIKKKWFYLPPPDVSERILPGDDLHWTGAAQRWNSMCADCHSTNLRKNFDDQIARYKTHFSEIDVSCEACHGAGGDHVDLANAYSLFWDRKQGKAIAGFKKGDPEKELGACFRCHSRRQLLTEDWGPGQTLSDVSTPELLSPLTYHCDGQIRDEVYEHGSFLQSQMYAKGIRCSDCHDPHSLKLKHTGNQVCTSCHQHSPGKYDSPAHHKHKPGGAGAQCVDCHMPTKTYMEVDIRRDHSLRVPRPDQSVALATPNACTGCHIDAKTFVAEGKLDKLTDTVPDTHLHAKPTDYHKLLELRGKHADIDTEIRRLDLWAAAKVNEWYGEKRERGAEYASALHAWWNNQPKGGDELQKLVSRRGLPPIIRASALAQLPQAQAPTHELLISSLDDPSPFLRAAACSAAEAQMPGAAEFLESNIPREQWISPQFARPYRDLARALAQRLTDPVKSVRVEAARSLAKLPSPLRFELLTGDDQKAWDRGIQEWQTAMRVNNDRSGVHTALGAYFECQENWDASKESYETAIRTEPNTIGARSNLSVLLERVAEDVALPASQRRFSLSGESDKESLLAQSRELIRQESEFLRRDAELAPHLGPLRYQYALALVRLKDYKKAAIELKQAVALEPSNTQYLFTLVVLLKEQAKTEGDRKELSRLAAKLIELAPSDPRFLQLKAEIDDASPAAASESGAKMPEKVPNSP